MTDNNFSPYSIQTLTNLPSTTPLPSPFSAEGIVCSLRVPRPSLSFSYQFLTSRILLLGMKGNAFEHHYPMLCEGTRQQRGDLALALLVYSRDDPTKIRQIMDVILDQNRYDLPSAAGTPQDKKRVERSDSQDNKDEGKESEASGTNVVKGKATIVLPNRKAR